MNSVREITLQLPVFEGPLDLLLDLIERAELDITRVALAQVTDQYLAYMKQASVYSLEDLTAFLVIASRLLQIKSEALLPRPPERGPEEEDPGDALARQLVVYKKYKQIAILLAQREAQGLRTYLRSAPPPEAEPQLELNVLPVSALAHTMAELLQSREPQVDLDEVIVASKVRIRDRIARVVSLLRRRGRTTFGALLRDTRSRLEVVVSFLAILELIKLRRVIAEQSEVFGEIEIVPGESWEADQGVDFELEFDE
jgi:segregation and condensation protein A